MMVASALRKLLRLVAVLSPADMAPELALLVGACVARRGMTCAELSAARGPTKGQTTRGAAFSKRGLRCPPDSPLSTLRKPCMHACRAFPQQSSDFHGEEGHA